MDKRAFQIIAKIGLILVVIGFFLPVSCDRNGFQIADALWSSGELFSADKNASILLYVLFVSALLGVVLLLIKKHSLGVDWILFTVGIGSGIIAISLVDKYSAFSSPQVGGYLMALGYLVTGVCLAFATFKFKNSSSDSLEDHDSHS